MTPFQKYEQ